MISASCFSSSDPFLLLSNISKILAVLLLVAIVVFCREDLEFSEVLFGDDLPKPADLFHDIQGRDVRVVRHNDRPSLQ